MFAEAIKERRKALGLTQQELADRLFVSRQTVSNWENGKNFPDIPTLIAISDQVDLSLDYLLKGDANYLEKVEEDYQLIKNKRKDRLVQLIAGATQLALILLAAASFFFREAISERIFALGMLVLCVPLVISSYLIYYASYHKEKTTTALFIPKAFGPGVTINPSHPLGKLIWGAIVVGILALLVYTLVNH